MVIGQWSLAHFSFKNERAVKAVTMITRLFQRSYSFHRFDLRVLRRDFLASTRRATDGSFIL